MRSHVNYSFLMLLLRSQWPVQISVVFKHIWNSFLLQSFLKIIFCVCLGASQLSKACWGVLFYSDTLILHLLRQGASLCRVLYILTRVWVLCTPNAGQHSHFHYFLWFRPTFGVRSTQTLVEIYINGELPLCWVAQSWPCSKPLWMTCITASSVLQCYIVPQFRSSSHKFTGLSFYPK